MSASHSSPSPAQSSCCQGIDPQRPRGAARIHFDRRSGIAPLLAETPVRHEPPAREIALAQLQVRENFLALSMSRPEMAPYQVAIALCLENVQSERDDLLDEI